MDQRYSNSLRQAAGLLKAGDAKKARAILVELLRQDSNIEQAWYMLSFTVPNLERQVYALEQTLRINPNNEKAKSRLAKLSGAQRSPIQNIPPEKSSLDQVAEPPRIPFTSAEESDKDLLSQRLFGDGVEAETLKLEDEDKTTIPPSNLPEPPELKSKKKASKKDAKKPRKGFLSKILTRRRLVLLVLTAVVGGSAVVFFPEQFGLPSASLGGVSDPTDTPTPESIPATLAVETETPSPSLTPTIPDSQSTPVPPGTPFGNQASPTNPNLPTPIIFPTADLNIEAPSALIQEEMDRVKAAILELRGLEDTPGDRTFLVSDTKMLNELQSFSRPAGYRVLIADLELTYRLLGLIDSNNFLVGYPPNLWVDPDGALYVPDNHGLLISGVGFAAKEKYLFVQGMGQDLINDQFDINSYGIYPLCVQEAQTCDAIRALVKGDAALLANQWLTSIATNEEQYLQDQPNYLILPVSSPPLFLEQDLAFPYISGENFAQALYNSGGWDAVNAAYMNLPETTEQILHPEKYLSEEGAVPVEHPPLQDILDDQWRQLFNESLGEWKLYLMLAYGADFSAVIDQLEAERAVTGWGGDQVQIYYNDFQSSYVLAAHWVWDSSTDASQFSATFEDYLEARNSAWAPLEFQDLDCWEQVGEVSCFYVKDAEVYWFIAPDIDTLTSIYDLYELGE